MRKHIFTDTGSYSVLLSNQVGFVDCPLVAISICFSLSVRVSINNVFVCVVSSCTLEAQVVVAIKLEIFCFCCWLLALESNICHSCGSPCPKGGVLRGDISDSFCTVESGADDS